MYEVGDIFPHPNFNIEAFENSDDTYISNNIALLKLKTEVSLNYNVSKIIIMFTLV